MRRITLPAILLLALCGCDTAADGGNALAPATAQAGNGATAPTKPQAGHIVGRVLDTRGQPLATLPLARRLPPASARSVYSAEARSPAGLDLMPKDMKSAWAFRFPPSAAYALAQLDPREAVAVEFLFAAGQGENVRRAYVEVGDFAAGRAFLQVASR